MLFSTFQVCSWPRNGVCRERKLKSRDLYLCRSPTRVDYDHGAIVHYEIFHTLSLEDSPGCSEAGVLNRRATHSLPAHREYRPPRRTAHSIGLSSCCAAVRFPRSRPKSCETGRGAQFEQLRRLIARNVDGVAELLFRLSGLGVRTPQAEARPSFGATRHPANRLRWCARTPVPPPPSPGPQHAVPTRPGYRTADISRPPAGSLAPNLLKAATPSESRPALF